jgi:hypothetical protein
MLNQADDMAVAVVAAVVNAAIAIASAAVPTVAGTVTLSCATPPMVHVRLVDLEHRALDDGLALERSHRHGEPSK